MRLILSVFTLSALVGIALYVAFFYPNQPSTPSSPLSAVPTPRTTERPLPSANIQENTARIAAPKLYNSRSGFEFDTVIKSEQAKVLGESTGAKKQIRVQIFAYNDENGNGTKEPGEQPLGFMPISVFDSPFSDKSVLSLNSTDSGWAGAVVEVAAPYQLIAYPTATKQYYPTTKPIILSETNNFAVAGFQKKTDQIFHITMFAFDDANKDTNINYDDPKETPLWLAPFKLYQQKEDGMWELLPNQVATSEGWATTTVTIKYPYKVKVEAGDRVEDGYPTLTPANKEVTISDKNATLIFPYNSK